jgi:hypothetical protein
MLLLAFAVALLLVAACAIARAARPPRACHYCSRMQPPRRLQQVELTDAGMVDVCRDVGPCRRAAARVPR